MVYGLWFTVRSFKLKTQPGHLHALARPQPRVIDANRSQDRDVQQREAEGRQTVIGEEGERREPERELRAVFSEAADIEEVHAMNHMQINQKPAADSCLG